MKKRKLIDEQGKIFGVISAVDILAVLLLVAILLMAYMRFFSGGKSDVSQSGFVPVSYELKVYKVREGTARAIRPGDGLVSEDGEDMGNVTAVSTAPAVELVECSDGTVRPMEVEGYVDVMIDVTAQGTVAGDRYYAGRTFELGAGAEVEFTSKYVSTTGVIWSVG